MLLQANIVCGTLSSFGSTQIYKVFRDHGNISNSRHFSCAIIDEVRIFFVSLFRERDKIVITSGFELFFLILLLASQFFFYSFVVARLHIYFFSPQATQATELDCLIPLQYGITKLILVGDPHQLPPTVLSKVSTTLLSNC